MYFHSHWPGKQFLKPELVTERTAFSSILRFKEHIRKLCNKGTPTLTSKTPQGVGGRLPNLHIDLENLTGGYLTVGPGKPNIRKGGARLRQHCLIPFEHWIFIKMAIVMRAKLSARRVYLIKIIWERKSGIFKQKSLIFFFSQLVIETRKGIKQEN